MFIGRASVGRTLIIDSSFNMVIIQPEKSRSYIEPASNQAELYQTSISFIGELVKG